jgi:type II secretory pathway component HofQ
MWKKMCLIICRKEIVIFAFYFSFSLLVYAGDKIESDVRSIVDMQAQQQRRMLAKADGAGAQTATGAVDIAKEMEPVIVDHWKTLTPEAPKRFEGAVTGTVTNMFYDTDIRGTLADIAAQTGTIIVPDLSVQGLVTAELKEVTLEMALRIVLAPGGYYHKQMDGFILVTSIDPEMPTFRSICDTRLVKLNHAQADDVLKLIPTCYFKFVKVDGKSNMVSISAPPPIVEGIMDFLKQVDQLPRQIMLDAIVVVMENGKLSEMGMQWDWPMAHAGIFSSDENHGSGIDGNNWPWGMQFGYTPGREFTNSLVTSLNLLAQNDQATVIASPQIVAMEGKEAEINVGTEEYFEILTEGYYQNSQLEKIEAGTILKIIPNISSDGAITLQLEAEVSDVVARGENNLPVVTRRKAKSTVRVEDGGTAVVAGLLDNRSRVNQERVPGLGRIPLAGRAFRNDAENHSSRQVAIFITPRLLNDGKKETTKINAKQKAIPLVGPEFKSELLDALQAQVREGGKR